LGDRGWAGGGEKKYPGVILKGVLWGLKGKETRERDRELGRKEGKEEGSSLLWGGRETNKPSKRGKGGETSVGPSLFDVN